MQRTVWVFGDAKIKIYEEVIDVGTLYAPDVPLLEYCYAQGATLNANAAYARRAVTGRGRRKLVPLSDFENITFSCPHLLFDKETEINFDSIFNTNKQLRLILEFSKIEYSGIPPFTNDIFTLSFCRATGFSISGQDDENIIGTANFEAELLLND